MTTSAKNIRRKFNELGSRWAYSGPVASHMHGDYLGIKSSDPIKMLEVLIRSGNREKFGDALVAIGYEFRPEMSNRKILYFTKKGHLPVSLILLDALPVIMTYDNVTPLVSLGALKKTNSVRKMVELTNVFKRLGNLNNVN